MMSLAIGLLAIATGTAFAGWLVVPMVGLVMGLTQANDRPVLTAATAGSAGWAVLLLWGMSRGPVLELANVLGGVMGGLPGAAVLGVTLLLPALLAGAAAGIGSAVRAMESDGA